MAQSSKSSEAVEVIFSAEMIAGRIDELAQDIARGHFDRLMVVAILKGSFVFAADLLRALYKAGIQPEVEFISLTSYRGTTVSSGQVNIVRDIESDVKDRNILLIDDILESGRTLAFAKDLLAARGAHKVATCVLLDKPVARAADIAADFRAFECPDTFVVGYGMDLDHKYRELPFVGRLRPDE
ncbi:hypoxanthine phosphoribosyltransferase [bacterium MnTg02]|nr:hypoxanthine phosphoribosyltransferase [bacterium MnTg02]